MTNRFYIFTVLAASLVLVSACVQKLAPVEDAGPHAVRMVLEGSVEPYEADNTKAASALGWKSGDVIYVRTETSAGVNTSYAQYGSDGAWTFNYTGALRTASKVQCCFFEKPKSTGVDQVTLSYNSAIYEDNAATLTVSDDGTVTLNTYLKPKTGRISFHGNSKAIKVSGLSWYSSFSLKDFSFTESVNANVKTFTASATNYFYGFFAEDNAEREVYVTTNENIVYKRSFGANVLRSGASGYVDVPTHDAYEGWTVTDESALEKFQPIVIEDANFEAWLLANGVDTDGDGEISIAEAERVHEIIIDGNETIQSLKGIEYFPNLTTLHVMGNETWDDVSGRWAGTGKLTAVDVSQNQKLQKLELGFQQLTALDLSNNPVLRELRIYSNKLTELAVHGGASLETLECSSNYLTSLDLSQFPSLRSLSCYQNQIATIDLSYCPNLSYLSIENNKLSALDVSILHSLDYLHCGGNQLSSLDVTGCPVLRCLYFDGNAAISSIDLSNCPKLTDFAFGNTAITYLDLSICPEIRYLWCTGAKLTSLDVTCLPKLEYLYCYDCGLTSLDLSGNPLLRDFGCGYNDLGSLDLSSCPQLQSLYCYNCGLTELELDYFPKLLYLFCWGNDFSSSGLSLSGCPNIAELSCENTNLYELDLTSNLKLRRLNCGWNNLTSLDIYANSELVRVNAEGMRDVEIIVKAGHGFPEGFYYSDTATITYLD